MTEDLFTYSEAEDRPPPQSGPRTETFTVELPHPDASVVSVHPLYGDRWSVTIKDRHGGGKYTTIETGVGPDTLTASRSVGAAVLAGIERRQAAELEERERLAARRASAPARAPLPGAATYPSGASVRPALAPRSRRKTESQGPGAAYTGSVPRNADVWDVQSVPGRGLSVRVILKVGLVWVDTHTSEERVFPTIRLAKDGTRAAVRA